MTVTWRERASPRSEPNWRPKHTASRASVFRPGGTQAFGDRAAADVEDGRGESAPGRDGAAPPVALPVEERVLDHVVAEVRAEGRWVMTYIL